MSRFNIPVVLFIFKRKDTVLKIIERIKNVEPSKIYIIGDEGRDDNEKLLAHKCRKAVEDAIDWNCEIIKNYAESNRGVHAQIGMGALWAVSYTHLAGCLYSDCMRCIAV